MADSGGITALPLCLATAQGTDTEILEGARIADLGLARASGGLVFARKISASGRKGAITSGARRGLFRFVYILQGSLHMHGMAAFGSGDALCQHDFDETTVREASDDLEYLELWSPDTPEARRLFHSGLRPFVSRDSPEIHHVGTGPRSFFDYRDLGLAEATFGVMEAQVIRAQKPREGGTGWHLHSMSQLSFGLGGEAILGCAGLAEDFRQAPGTALCIPDGVVHNAHTFTRDYAALQVQFPAIYTTEPAPPPARAAYCTESA